jgi:hypothetical protein
LGDRSVGSDAGSWNHWQICDRRAFAAVLHAEPISTIDLAIFFLFKEKQAGPILNLDQLYQFAKKRGFPFDHEFININGW